MPGTDTTRTARFWPRAAAYLLDRAILGVVLLGPRLAMLFRSLGSGSRAVLFRFTAGDILCWVLAATYFVLLTAFAGGTLGKKAMGLRVVTKTGEKPAFLTILWRETFARYLSGILLIGYLLCAADPENGTLHDRICDTRVVYAEPRRVLPAAPVPAPAEPAINPVDDPIRDWYAPYRK